MIYNLLVLMNQFSYLLFPDKNNSLEVSKVYNKPHRLDVFIYLCLEQSTFEVFLVISLIRIEQNITSRKFW